METWKDIVRWEDLYQVSNCGNVKSKDRIVERNQQKYVRKGKLLKLSKNSLGYLVVGLTRNSKTLNVKVHRLVGEAFINKVKNKNFINHIDGNKTNNKVSNLEWCNASENSKHAFNLGLSTSMKINRFVGKEEENSNSLLTKQQVIEIRNKYIPFKYSAKKLAKEYNVSQSCIEHILRKRSWKNV